MPGKFQYPHSEWAVWESFTGAGTVTDWEEAPAEFTSAIALLEDNQRALEDFLAQMSGGKLAATFIVGTTASGHTADEVDYLCDGIDDQVEINAALSALPNTPAQGRVLLLEGTYNTKSTINVPDGATLQGQGSFVTIIKGASGANWGYHGVIWHAGGGTGDRPGHLLNLTVDKNSIGGGDATVVWGGTTGQARFHDVRIINSTTYALWFNGYQGQTTVSDCYMGSVLVSDGGPHLFTNSYMGYIGSSLGGRYIVSGCLLGGGDITYHGGNCVVSGCIITGEFGMRVDTGKASIITGCHFEGPGSGRGLRLHVFNRHPRVIGNTFSGWGTAIHYDAAGDSAWIASNKIYNNTIGIRLDGGSPQTVATAIVANDLRGNTTAISNGSTDPLILYANVGITNTAGPTGLLTTKGDLLGFTTLEARVPVGANATIFTADSTQGSGLLWNTLRAVLGLTTKGDQIVDNGTAPVRVPVGADGKVWTADSTDAEGVAWLDLPADADSFADLAATATTGDIIYYDGADFVVLPIGTLGQTLTVSAGGLPEWA